ncbi:MAG: hypothetical protein DWQ47_00775 [Acidobacteria bacterium]|nr:MAG: hypothetical protein DWQ32_11235 [Acidobacteriota bacterium]REK04039.1 MAG: hypothetical protein DWQ38_00760 [Acidobacteriota bacterium]REK15201.1 MAG: hypothetical protein DWQ43_16925 [Acidobacteriota bacterium]REK46291.1 MAG: hypothetical protein DWQ47_00775 [Acidobacteriota bacterium]
MNKPERHFPVLKLLFVLLVFAAAGAFVPAYGQSCSSITDEQIIDGVYSEFEKNNDLSSQISRLNFTIVKEPTSGQVQAWKIQGWVNDQNEIDDVMDIIRDVYDSVNGKNCFPNLKFNQNQLYTASEVPSGFKAEGGCTGDTKPCGDICIPVGETCSITGRTKQSN